MIKARHTLPGFLGLLVCCNPALSAEDTQYLEIIEIYADAPLGAGAGETARAPANVQSLDSEELSQPGNRSVSDALQALGSVHRSDATGNPFQPDLFYRGYSTSPLLGLPQGMAVYQDGVRINEPFGDTINLDLVPQLAIRQADLVPGSNPVYGRNTLAGALALTTKTGFDSPGIGMTLTAGEFGRRGLAAEYGANTDRHALYLAAEGYEEDGWRDFSRSRVTRLFGRGTWLPDDLTQVDLSLTAADNRLRGNGAAPLQLLESEGREAVFTHPDETRPELLFINLSGRRELAHDAQLTTTAYYRQNTINTFNGDGTEFEACDDPANSSPGGDRFLCEEEDNGEEVVNNLAGDPVVARESNDSATQNRSRTRQDGFGLALQLTKPLGDHRLVGGVSIDFGDIEFESDTELGRLTPARGTVGSGIFVAESVVDVHARNDSMGVYIQDTWHVTGRLDLSAAGRWNRTLVELDDQIPGGDLSGKHRFSRFNPMLGAAYRLRPGLTAFGSLSQSTRAPTPVELTCANPDDPCRLPNGFVDDPPLDEVVTRTAEAGLRYRGDRWSGAVALFHAVSRDDILFITDGNLTNTGYFDNVGETLRQGLEITLAVKLGGGWQAEAAYTALSAEFREDFLVNSPNHPLRNPQMPDQPAQRTRQVQSGDEIPLIPNHQGRLALTWRGARFDLGLEALGRGRSRYRGDEANVDSEQLSGFVILNAKAGWQMSPSLRIFASIDNLLDKDYETFGVYGEGDEVLGDDFEDARRFVGAGAPATFEAGIRWQPDI